MSYTQLSRILLSVLLIGASNVAAQECPEESPLQHYTGAGSVVCPCFVAGEQAGAVFEAPEEHYPIQILRVGLGWGSQFGGAPQQIEESINIYGAGLPNPGSPLYSLPGPLLTDGAINEFNLESLLGEVIVDSGAFAVTLKFLYENAGDPFAPSMVHDGNGCQIGKNVVYAIPGGWADACLLGVTGDWVIYVIYRQVDCTTGISEEHIVLNGAPAFLWAAQPNPFSASTMIDFYVAKESRARLSVYDVRGSEVAILRDCTYMPGKHSIMWDGRNMHSQRLSSGVYFFELQVENFRTVQKVIISR